MFEILRQYFKDEFINRIDEIILFDSLDTNALTEIAMIKINDLKERLMFLDINLEISDDVYLYLANRAILQKGFGARPLNRLIVSQIENRIAEMVVDGRLKKGDTVGVGVADGNIICMKKDYALTVNDL